MKAGSLRKNRLIPASENRTEFVNLPRSLWQLLARGWILESYKEVVYEFSQVRDID